MQDFFHQPYHKEAHFEFPYLSRLRDLAAQLLRDGDDGDEEEPRLMAMKRKFGHQIVEMEGLGCVVFPYESRPLAIE